MSAKRHILGCLAAAGLTAGAFGLAGVLRGLLGPYVFPELYLVAVALSAWAGGLGPALLAALASAALIAFTFGRAVAPLRIAGDLVFFVLAALTLGWLRGRVAAAAERAAVSAVEAEAERRRLTFLAEASRVLAASLDYEATLSAVARLAVPFLADYCAVDLLEDDGQVRRVAIAHVAPEKEAIARELVRQIPIGSSAGHPTLLMLRTGEGGLIPEVDDSIREAIAGDPEQLRMMQRLGVRSALGVPLVARGRTLGAISCMVTESARRYEPRDLALAEELAGRCATAIDNARLYRAAQAELDERRRAETRLGESERRLQLAFQAAHMGAFEWNVATDELVVDGAENLPGFPLGEETVRGDGTRFFERLHPDDRDRVRTAIDRALRDGGEYDVESRVVWPGGTVRWVALKGMVVPGEADGPTRVIGAPMDVTERKRTEQRLAVQYEVTRVLAESTSLEEAAPKILRAVCECLGWVHGALWRLDADAGVLRLLETWHVPGADVGRFDTASRLTNFPIGIGLPGRVWARGEPAWIPDVTRDPNFPRQAVAAAEGLHGAFGFPIRAGGELLGVLEFFSFEIMPPDVQLLAMIANVGIQIGQFLQRRRAEEERAQVLAREQAARANAERAEGRAAFLAEASRALAASLDYPATLEGLARLAVPYLADWCTIDVLTEQGGIERVAVAHAEPAKVELLRGLLRRWPPDPGDRLRAAIAAGRAVRYPDGLDERRLGPLAPDRREILEQLEIRSFMLVPLVARGRTLGAISFAARTPGRYGDADLALAEDLGRRAGLAVDNAWLYRQAQEVARRKDEFLAMLGHELRNPLGAIRGAIGVLDRVSPQSEPAVRQRAIIDRQTRHLARLVDDLLDVSRVVSGKIVLKPEPLDLHEVVVRSVQALRARSEERQLEVSITRGAAPVMVHGDPVRLEQVLFNLVDNAIKYTPPGGRVAVVVERAGGEAVIRVRDSGMGVAPDLLPRVFDLFTQAERSLDRGQGGLGLGLTLVRSLIEQHGGRVEAHSAGPGSGSEFVVRLPALAETAAVAVEAGPPPRAEMASVPGLRVLVIEDNVDGREAIRALLEFWGYRVEVAEDGPRGLERARRSVPEVALVDIGLPGLDGYEIARRLRAELGGRIRMVALTGYGQSDDRRRAHDAGFDAHLVKPVEPEALARVLAEMTAAGAA